MPLLSADTLRPVLDKAAESAKQIDAIDEQLGERNSGKTRVLNAAADRVVDTHGSLADQIRAAIDDVHGADRVGVVALIRRELKAYDDEVKNYVDQNVTSNEDQLPVEEQQRLREERKTLVGVIDSVRTMLKNVAPELLDQVPEYKNLRGAVGGAGPRGKRLKGAWKHAVDGVVIPGRTLGDVKAACKVDSVADVRVALESANPGYDFEERKVLRYTVNGHEVVSTPDEDVDEDDDLDVSSSMNSDIFDDDER